MPERKSLEQIFGPNPGVVTQRKSLDEIFQRTSTPVTPPSQPSGPPGAFGVLAPPSVSTIPTELGVGAMKGLGEGAYQFAKVGEKLTNATGISKLFDAVFGPMPLPEQSPVPQPTGIAEKIGYGAEKLGELMVPIGKTPSIITKAAKFGKAAVLAAKALVGGADFAGRTFLQTGGDVKKTAEAGAIGAATPPAMAAAGKVIEKAAPAIGRTAAAVVGAMIGKEPEHVIKAFKNPVKVAEGMAKRVMPIQVRESAIKALDQFKESYHATFNKGLESAKTLYPYGKTGKLLIQKEVQDTTKGLPAAFRDLRISVLDDGRTLNFDKLNSAIVSPTEQVQLQRAWDTIKNQKDFSVQGTQDVAARLNALTHFAEGGKNVSSVAVAKLLDVYSRAIERSYPELATLRSEYKAASKIYNEIDSVLKSVADDKPNVATVTSATKKLSNLFHEDNEAYLRAIQKLEEVSGVDLLNDLAASEFKNIVGRAPGSIIAQGTFLAGGIFSNPFLLLTLPLFSPRLEGKIITTAGKLAPAVTKNAPGIIKAGVKAGTRAIQDQ